MINNDVFWMGSVAAAGLIVAVPTLAGYSYLTARTDRLRLILHDAIERTLTAVPAALAFSERTPLRSGPLAPGPELVAVNMAVPRTKASHAQGAAPDLEAPLHKNAFPPSGADLHASGEASPGAVGDDSDPRP